jgi:hypothetical protein
MSEKPASLTPDPIEAEHRKRLLPWATKAVDLVTSKVEDARAHAENAVTATLKATPDGRPSLAKLRANRSYMAALNRLNELWTQIGGPSVTSSAGFVHDAAEAFYWDSRRLQWERIEPDFRVASQEPTQAQLAYVRSLLWFGVPVRQGFESQFATTRTSLLQAMSVAGSSDLRKRDATSALDTWEQQALARLIPRLGLALADANQRADDQAMKDTIRPEFQGES